MQIGQLKRRKFITLLGGAAAWPLAARAQAERVRRIGALTPLPADHPDAHARYAAFLQALRQLGWTEGRNVQIEARWSAGDAAITRRQALELVALTPDVILASGSLGAEAILQATRSIPVVFVPWRARGSAFFFLDAVSQSYQKKVQSLQGNSGLYGVRS